MMKTVIVTKLKRLRLKKSRLLRLRKILSKMMTLFFLMKRFVL
uniref:Uncharacterized protein n=1 Tax=Myoviridae sp. ctbEa13 TaxID=2825136 RepID=A0A8S5VBP4_9CAUD|nr:MAG TPA: hypothetical protein [Myoviridae sp. ctbEa13]